MSIEERIEKHKLELVKAEEHYHEHDRLRGFWNSRAMFHVDAIRNLEVKKAKQQPKKE